MKAIQIVFGNKRLQELYEKHKDVEAKYSPVKGYDFGKPAIRQFIRTLADLEDLNPRTGFAQMKKDNGWRWKFYDGCHHIRVNDQYRLTFDIEFEDEAQTIIKTIKLLDFSDPH